MPRIVTEPSRRNARFDALVDDLVRELHSDATTGEPLVLENQSSPSAGITVHVIWDRWKEVPEDQRGPLIQEAYRRAFGDDYRQRILFVLGLTLPEAVRRGLLPWIVEPSRWRHPDKNGEPPAERYRQAMTAEEGSVYLAEHGPQLRYHSLELAEAARERMLATLPGSKWLIIEEVSAE